MVEIQSYRVVREIARGVELRHYPAHDLVCVDVGGNFENVGYQGFGYLASYISGNNQRGTKIAMTSPVIQESQKESQHTLCFVLPEMVALAGTPAPTSPAVRIRRQEPGYVAALTFRGSWRVDTVDKATEELRRHLAEAGIVEAGKPFYARYNPPSVPGFLRRNEVLIPISFRE